MIHILLVEDDKDLSRAVRLHLERNGFPTTACENPHFAFDAMEKEHFDLIISDIMMPEMDGYDFAALIRKNDQNIPILFMTARDDFVSKRKGYQIGIDDYMVKPVDLEEMLLHIEALLRRAHIANSKKLEIGALVLDENEVAASFSGETIPLTLREFQILFKLLSYPNKTFTRGQLLDEFAGPDSESGLRTVDVHITNLRNKFADYGDFEIKTVRGLGYKAVLK